MQALNEDQRIAPLEKKIDEGFTGMRADFKAVRTEMRTEIKRTERELRGEIIAARTDARSDFRTLIAVTFAMWVTTILCFVGVLLQHHL